MCNVMPHILKIQNDKKNWGKEKNVQGSICSIYHSNERLYQTRRFPPRQSAVMGQRVRRLAQLLGPDLHKVTQCPHCQTYSAQFVLSKHMKHTASVGLVFVTWTTRLNLEKSCLNEDLFKIHKKEKCGLNNYLLNKIIIKYKINSRVNQVFKDSKKVFVDRRVYVECVL